MRALGSNLVWQMRASFETFREQLIADATAQRDADVLRVRNEMQAECQQLVDHISAHHHPLHSHSEFAHCIELLNLHMQCMRLWSTAYSILDSEPADESWNEKFEKERELVEKEFEGKLQKIQVDHQLEIEARALFFTKLLNSDKPQNGIKPQDYITIIASNRAFTRATRTRPSSCASTARSPTNSRHHLIHFVCTTFVWMRALLLLPLAFACLTERERVVRGAPTPVRRVRRAAAAPGERATRYRTLPYMYSTTILVLTS